MAEAKRIRVDAAGVRALAHPLRLRILDALRAGPATSTQLARELGESTGSTSYHLRSLGRFGLIEEVEGRGRGRERWWRRPEGVQWAVGEHELDARAAGMSAVSVMLARDEQALAGYLEIEEALEDEWRDAATIVGWGGFAATPGELREFTDAVARLVDDLRRTPGHRPDARPIFVTFRVLPQAVD